MCTGGWVDGWIDGDWVDRQQACTVHSHHQPACLCWLARLHLPVDFLTSHSRHSPSPSPAPWAWEMAVTANDCNRVVYRGH